MRDIALQIDTSAVKLFYKDIRPQDCGCEFFYERRTPLLHKTEAPFLHIM